jgi:hypothetical protein
VVTHRWHVAAAAAWDSTLSVCVSTSDGADLTLSLSAVGCFQLITCTVGAYVSKLCQQNSAQQTTIIQLYGNQLGRTGVVGDDRARAYLT